MGIEMIYRKEENSKQTNHKSSMNNEQKQKNRNQHNRQMNGEKFRFAKGKERRFCQANKLSFAPLIKKTVRKKTGARWKIEFGDE